jgi:hypothetical protein
MMMVPVPVLVLVLVLRADCRSTVRPSWCDLCVCVFVFYNTSFFNRCGGIQTSCMYNTLADGDDSNHHAHRARHKIHRERFPSLHEDYYSYNHTYHDDGRILWSNVTESDFCLAMYDVPAGQHVLGILTNKKTFYLSHMIIVN